MCDVPIPQQHAVIVASALGSRFLRSLQYTLSGRSELKNRTHLTNCACAGRAHWLQCARIAGHRIFLCAERFRRYVVKRTGSFQKGHNRRRGVQEEFKDKDQNQRKV